MMEENNYRLGQIPITDFWKQSKEELEYRNKSTFYAFYNKIGTSFKASATTYTADI